MAKMLILRIVSEVTLHLREMLLQLDENRAALGRVDSLIDSYLVLARFCLFANWLVKAAAGVCRVEGRDSHITCLQIEFLGYKWLTLV